MTRHEIRIRRGSFASNRIQRHKDYSQLLSQHRRYNRAKTVVLSVIILLIIFMLIAFAYKYFSGSSDMNSYVVKALNIYHYLV